ncbi:MAG TPA: hypothetical protein VII28_15300 [Puia sp.]
MRPFKIIIPALLYFIVVSCDIVSYVGVRNYQGPCRVQVTYDKSDNTFHDNDSLFFGNFNNTKFDSLIIRTNTSPNSYFFIAPREKVVRLMPTSLGQPIKQVEIFNAIDSPWIIHPWNRKELKKLEKLGQITLTGFPIKRAIWINNGFEK